MFIVTEYAALKQTAMSHADHKVGKHVTLDVIFATVRAQPYWKLCQYAASFLCFFLHNTKLVNKSKHPFQGLAKGLYNLNIFIL